MNAPDIAPGSGAMLAKPALAASGLSSWRRAFTLAMLTLIAACSVLDRTIINLVLEPIRREFSLSDTQLGIAAGLAYSIAHATVSLPLGRLADRVSRLRLISVCLLAWSAMTALCGQARSFPQLLLARMGVGAGEAGGQLTSLSVVTDLYPEKNRATAVAIFYLASPLGVIGAGLIGGAVTAAYGWRAAMLVASVPGVFLAIVLFLFGKEPSRATAANTESAAPRLGEVLRFLVGQRALMHLLVGMGLASFTLSGLGSFVVSFFIRYHHVTQQDMGAVFGVVGAAGTLVMLGGGLLADRLGRRDPRWRLWLIIPAQLANMLLLLAAFLVRGPLALPAYVAAALLGQVWLGPGLATAQSLTPSRMRATGAAMVLLFVNMMGYGFGPVILGALSDALNTRFPHEGLRASLVVISLLDAWVALQIFLATRTLRADLARAQAVA